MNIVFVHEDGQIETIVGDVQSTYDTIVKLTTEQPKHSGFLSAVDSSGRVRGSVQFHEYRGKFRNLVYDFVRKFRALEVVERYAATVKFQANND